MIEFTGNTPEEITWKRKLHAVLFRNELGNNPVLAFQLSNAGGRSGWSFGYPQWDLVGNAARASSILTEILRTATTGGQRIVGDDDITRLVESAKSAPGSGILSDADRNLINQALNSAEGRRIVEREYDLELGQILTHVDNVIASVADSRDRDFLRTDVAKLFLCDYHGELGSEHNFSLY